MRLQKGLIPSMGRAAAKPTEVTPGDRGELIRDVVLDTGDHAGIGSSTRKGPAHTSRQDGKHLLI
jgi:hypothetical protein